MDHESSAAWFRAGEPLLLLHDPEQSDRGNAVPFPFLCFFALGRPVPSPTLDWIRGAAVAYLILTTSVDALLLSGYGAHRRIPMLSIQYGPSPGDAGDRRP